MKTASRPVPERDFATIASEIREDAAPDFSLSDAETSEMVLLANWIEQKMSCLETSLKKAAEIFGITKLCAELPDEELATALAEDNEVLLALPEIREGWLHAALREHCVDPFYGSRQEISGVH